MGVVPFFTSLAGTVVVVLMIAIIIGVAVAFFLSSRTTGIIRTLTEWATALSGAGYVAIVLAWHPWQGPYPALFAPALLGFVVAVSYLPLAVMLLLRILEPRWTVLVTCRAYNLPVTRTFTTLFNSTKPELINALGLFVARLISDSAVLTLFLFGGHYAWIAVFILVVSAYLLKTNLLRFVEITKLPAYPPLFGPLPELPPRLRMAPRVPLAGKLAFQLSLIILCTTALAEFAGLGFLRDFTPVGSGYLQVSPGKMTLLSVGMVTQGAIVMTLLSVMVVWSLSSSCRNGHHKSTLYLAGISPLIFSLPWTFFLQTNQLTAIMLAIAGLTSYVCLQYAGACTVQNTVSIRNLIVGDNTRTAAIRALGLSNSNPSSQQPAVSEVLSAAATWFSAAAFVAVLSNIEGRYLGPFALVCSILACVLQSTAMWLRSSRPWSFSSMSPSSGALEALPHDIA